MSRAEPVAPFEQLSAERFEAVIDTNIYGVVNITRGAVPHMRRRRNGCILQILSVGGRLTRLGSTPYHAAKWAVGGFAEPLAQELSPFGMKVCALEPGGMRTNWARAKQDTPERLTEYEPSVGAIAKTLKSYWVIRSAIPPRLPRL
jgi:NAD(P)-dependent dehydrogenase (short-subunit alcohol dehydrogenase family)